MPELTATWNCPDPECEYEHEYSTEVEPAFTDGTDADGRRGWRVPAYATVPVLDDMPTECKGCGRQYSEDDRKEILKQVELDISEWNDRQS